MAEALVFSVLQNIASFLAESALSTITSKLVTAREVGDSMKKIESEFEVIQAYITQVDIRSGKDKTFETWLQQLRKVAHDVEDVIDEYVYLIGQQKSSGMTETLRKYIPYSKKNTALCNIADQLKQLEDRVQNIKSMKNLIGDSKIGRGGSSDLNYAQTQKRSESRGGSSDLNYAQAQNVSESPYVTDDDEIVGRRKETEQLLKLLEDEKKERAIISICAIDGSGKTTLARSIYKNARIKRRFDRSAWVSVSPKLTADKLFKDVAKQLLKDNQDIVNKIETMDRTKLVEELGSHLEKKRYLIVLDDMWTKDALLHLLKSIVENNCKSRVVITTNPSKDVHSLADNDRKMELKPLSNEEAWVLFCKKAFEKQDNYRCPEFLQILAKNIVKKCDGLPLLIVAIGSLLSYKEKKKDEWESFYNQLNWQLENNPELDGPTHGVLDLSFTDLPSYLKSCFLYCGLLPEKYPIDKDWIIRLWIAEGFIEERGSRLTLEKVGELYLEKLVHRNLLQVVDTDDFGRSTLFQIRDVFRDRTLTRSRKEMFGITHDDPEITESGSEVKARRVSIHKGSETLQPSFHQLRSYFLFDRQLSASYIHNVLYSFRLLRVLSLRRTKIDRVPDKVGRLFNLRYLDLSSTSVENIPRSLGKLLNLQTLDLRGTRVKKLPKEVTKLQKLRHLFLFRLQNENWRVFAYAVGVSVPHEISNLGSLQSLNGIQADRDLLRKIGKATQLRKLVITNMQESYCQTLWDSIAKMTNLSFLVIVAKDEKEVLSLTNFKPLENLQTLKLRGRLEGEAMRPSVSYNFGNVMDLDMAWSELQRDMLPSLSKISNLVVLRLFRAYIGHGLAFRAGWFPNLKVLSLGDLLELVWINIENGTMTNLQELTLFGLENLGMVPNGIENLKSIKLYQWNMPEAFVEMLRKIHPQLTERMPTNVGANE